MTDQTIKDVSDLEAKKEIERNLLDAISVIDTAIFNIGLKLTNQYGNEILVLDKSRTEIVKIINKHFSRLAREMSSTSQDANKPTAPAGEPGIKPTAEVKKMQKVKFQYWDNFYNILLGTYATIDELKKAIIDAGGVTPHWKKMENDLETYGEFTYCDKIYLIKKVPS